MNVILNRAAKIICVIAGFALSGAPVAYAQGSTASKVEDLFGKSPAAARGSNADTNVNAKSNMTTVESAEKQRIEKIVRDYLLRNPEILIEMSTLLEAKQQDQQKSNFRAALASARDELLNDKMSPSTGNVNGKTVIVEFSDYNCPYCRRMAPIIERAIKSNPDLKIIMKEFPILGPASRYAAKAALAAKMQNKYKALHWALFENKGRLDKTSVDRIASKVGLDMVKLKKDMESPEIEQAIARTIALGEKLGIRGTPAFIAGDTLAPGALSEEAFRTLVEAATPKS